MPFGDAIPRIVACQPIIHLPASSRRRSSSFTRRASARPAVRFMTCPTRNPNSWSFPDRYSSTCDGNSASTPSISAPMAPASETCPSPSRSITRARRLAGLEDGGQHRLGIGGRDAARLHLADELRQPVRAERHVIGAQRIGGVLVQQAAELAGDPVRRALGRDAAPRPPRRSTPPAPRRAVRTPAS